MATPQLISILTPTYNRASLLKETIESVLAQDDGGIEYVILDDGSTDETRIAIEPYRSRLTYHFHENVGETITLNRGIKLARGEWIAIVNSDDPLLPGWLSAMRAAIHDHPDAKLFYPDWLRIDAKGRIVEVVKQPDYDIFSMLPHHGCNNFSCTIGPGMLVHRTLYEQLGYRNEAMYYGADIDLIYRAALSTRLQRIPQVLATHREHPDSLSCKAQGMPMAGSLSDMVRRITSSHAYPDELKRGRSYTLFITHVLILMAYTGRSRRGRALFAARALYYGLICLPVMIKNAIISSFKQLARLLPINRLLAAAARRALVRQLGCHLVIAALRWRYFRRESRESTSAVLFTGPSFPPDFSGQAVVLGRLFEHMKDVPIRIATTQRAAGSPAESHYLFLPQVAQAQGSWARLKASLFQLSQLARYVARQRPEVVIACSADVTLPLVSWLVARAARARFYFYQFDDYVHQWWASPQVMRLAAFNERLMATRMTGFIVPCAELGNILRGRFPSVSIHIVPNPSDGKPPVHAAQPAGRAPVLAFTGSIYHLNERLMRSLARALELLVDHRPQLHIYSGIAKERLTEMGFGGSQVRLCGYAEPAMIPSILAGVDIAVICLSLDIDSRTLVNSSATAKLADYLAAGKPVLVLAPRESYAARYVIEHGCGIVCDSHDPEAIAAALAPYLANPAWLAQAASNALACAARDFDPRTAVAMLKDALDADRAIRQMQGMIAVSKQKVAVRRPLRIVQITSVDQPGAQANGMLLHQYYRARGLDSTLMVHRQRSDAPGTYELGGGLHGIANELAVRLERRLSLHHQFGLLSGRLAQHPAFEQADIIHMQLTHASSFASWSSLARLLAGRRVVWTIHDMYMFTGHCVYSLGCSRWQSGCGECPDFDIPFSISRDTTAALYRSKEKLFRQVRPQLVVASSWMDEAVSQSPILKELPRTRIPFGTMRTIFSPRDKKAARASFGIAEDAHVISFRSVPFAKNFKGMEMIEEALRRLSLQKPTYLLTFQEKSGLDSLRNKYQFIELGWTEDQELMALAHSATDVFLMPSSAEAFGIMAIEAQACAAPVIVAQGTALPETAGAPGACLVVPQNDAQALADAIARLLGDSALRASLGKAALEHIDAHHDFITHAEAHLDLYESMMAKS